ncbi:phosphoglycerate mutase-like protein [Aureobasidium pullulans]|uniref:3-phytase n=1 Tax=Aureobasidium pullulans TaxID=5580 RepID=A0A4S9B7Z3_AURPU|nr:phosphoglycerate mutase-like protein [Aureobasidium pullulans]
MAEVQWLRPTRDYFGAIMNNWKYPQISATNTTNDWNILYHLGGNGPWIPKADGVVEGGLAPPEGCRVEQVHMVARHNERYPTSRTAAKMVSLHNRLRTLDFNLQGDLSFFHNWTFFMPQNYTSEIGKLIPTGPYAGTLGAFAAGVSLRTQYPDLQAASLSRNQTNFWAADSHRVEESAKYFAAGFWGIEWRDVARLQVIPETKELGADTLTTGVTCVDYLRPHNPEGRHKGLHKLVEWQKHYVPPIIARMESQNPGLNLTIHEVFSMQQLCGFEILARGSSPWCNIFTEHEWKDFEYARDLLHYYRTGSGNKYSAARGFPFLNATTNILSTGPSAGSVFFSFVHDGDILPLLSTLDLFPSSPLPTDHAPEPRVWKISDVVPMGGRVIFERLACPQIYCHSNAPLYPNHIYCDPPKDEPYIRVIINDGVVAIPDCQDGPGKSCALASFERKVMLRGWEVGDFGKTCGLEEGAADKVTFLHQ